MPPSVKSVISYRRRLNSINRKKKIHGRHCTCNWRDKQRSTVKWLFEKIFYFLNLFSQSADLPVYLVVFFFYLSIYIFLSYNFSMLNIFQGFSLNFINEIAGTLGRAVAKLLNGSRVNSHGQFIFGKQRLSLFRGDATLQGNRRCNFSHFLDRIKTGLSLLFSLRLTANYENREFNTLF